MQLFTRYNPLKLLLKIHVLPALTFKIRFYYLRITCFRHTYDGISPVLKMKSFKVDFDHKFTNTSFNEILQCPLSLSIIYIMT